MGRNLTIPPSVKPGIPKLGAKPKGWREVAFKDILTVVVRPAQVKPDRRYQLINAKRSRGGIVPRATLLGKQIKTTTQFIAAANDFVISRRQIVHGACGIVPPELDGALVSNEYSTLVPKDGLLLPYLGYYAHTIHFQQTCFNSSVGVAIEKMVFNLDHWLRHRLYLPPLEYQRKVVAILSTTDRVIVGLAKLIAAKRKLKQGLAQQLLTGQRRLPGFGKPAVEGRVGMETRCGWIPTDWKCVALGNVASINPQVLPESTPGDYRFSYIDLSMIKVGTVQFPAQKIQFSHAPSRARRVVTKDDITMSTVRPNLLGHAYWSDQVENVICSTGFAVIRATKASAPFIYQWLYTTSVARYFDGCIAGTGYPALNPGDVKHIPLPCPSSKEQTRIAAVLGAADRELVLLEKKLAALRELKKGLMQRLLIGPAKEKAKAKHG